MKQDPVFCKSLPCHLAILQFPVGEGFEPPYRDTCSVLIAARIHQFVSYFGAYGTGNTLGFINCEILGCCRFPFPYTLLMRCRISSVAPRNRTYIMFLQTYDKLRRKLILQRTKSQDLFNLLYQLSYSCFHSWLDSNQRPGH